MKKEEKNVEEISEVKEECVSCDDCGCGCEEFDYAPIHKWYSCANIASLFLKGFALLFLIIQIYTMINYMREYPGDQIPFLDIVGSVFSCMLMPLFIYVAGEVINLLNRIKESLF